MRKPASSCEETDTTKAVASSAHALLASCESFNPIEKEDSIGWIELIESVEVRHAWLDTCLFAAHIYIYAYIYIYIYINIYRDI